MRTIVAIVVVLGLTDGRARAQRWKEWVPSLPSTPRSVQTEGARRLMPVALQLRPSGERAPSARTLRVRVWAAADFRRQTVEWQSRFRRLLDRVNAACRTWPGVRFELVETRSWDRESREGAMPALVDELVRLDPGDDVDLVVGLVAAMPVFPGSIDNIGMAQLFSRHMVMRSLHDLAEFDAVRRAFDELTDREREAVVAARKVHKEEVIFLHEWAHTLGVIHVQRPSGIMSPAYDASQAGFDAIEARLIDEALRHRAEDGPRWREGTVAEVRALVESSPDPDWDPRDRQTLVALAAPASGSPAPTRTASPAPTSSPPVAEAPLGDADRTAVAQAVAQARAGRYDEAWHRFAPLEARHPRSVEVRLAACELAWRHPSGAARASLAEVACHAAAELAPRDPRPHLYLADLYLGGGDPNRARAPLARAEELLDGAPGDADGWRLLALTLEKARLPTLAERAAAHADHDTAVAVGKWAAAQRRRVALPADAQARGVSPELEAEYIRAVEAARAALGTPTEAASIAAAAHEFDGLSVGELLRCEAALRRGQADPARAACSAVLPARGHASLAQLRAAYADTFGR